MPMEYLVPSLWIASTIGMDATKSLDKHITQLIELEEDRFIVGFHHPIKKDRQKVWHDHHIKTNNFPKDI